MDHDATVALSYVPSFTSETHERFRAYLNSNPSTRRIDSSERLDIIAWLRDEDRRPSSQKDQSRRNYVRKTFACNKSDGMLRTQMKGSDQLEKIVVLQDDIIGVVQDIHEEINHAGWDATWSTLSSRYHGILRNDVIFLLRECQVCKHDPRKRQKNPTNLFDEGAIAGFAVDLNVDENDQNPGRTNWRYQVS